MNPPEKIRVVLADDHQMFRDALKAYLKADCEIVGEAVDGPSAVALAVERKPRVIILDISMAGVDGLVAAREIARQASSVRVLIVSRHGEEEYIVEAFSEAGVAGYVLKHDSGEQLLAAVRAVAAGKRYVSPNVAPIVLEQLNRHDSEAPRLTRREREVLRMVAEGASTKDIAARLKISPKTAQVHRDNLKQKLDLHSIAAMVHYAIKHKLVRLD